MLPPPAGGPPLKCCPGVKCVHCCFLCFCGHAFEVFAQVWCSHFWVILECIIQSRERLFSLLLHFRFFLLSPWLSSSLHPLFLFFFSPLGPSHFTLSSMKVSEKRGKTDTLKTSDSFSLTIDWIEGAFEVKCWAYDRKSVKKKRIDYG